MLSIHGIILLFLEKAGFNTSLDAEIPVCACGVEGEVQALIRIFVFFTEYRRGSFFVSKKLTVSPLATFPARATHSIAAVV